MNRCFLYGAIKLIDKGFRVGIVTFSDAAMAGPGQVSFVLLCVCEETMPNSMPRLNECAFDSRQQKLAGGSLVRALLKAAFQQHLRQKNPGWDEAQLKEESNRICGEFLVCALHPTIQNKLLGGQANLPLSKEYHISVVLEEAKRKCLFICLISVSSSPPLLVFTATSFSFFFFLSWGNYHRPADDAFRRRSWEYQCRAASERVFRVPRGQPDRAAVVALAAGDAGNVVHRVREQTGPSQLGLAGADVPTSTRSYTAT